MLTLKLENDVGINRVHVLFLWEPDQHFRSGLLNFCAVAMALDEMGYQPKGIRIDSGDLAYLSTLARQKFEQIAEK